MKKIILNLFIGFISYNHCYAQNLFNPYELDLSGKPYSTYINPNGQFQYSSYKPYAGTPYNGEYEINISDLFWFRDFAGVTISYDIEIVSFPFT